ncbi:uncharacterized protein LOC127842646 [Dreissena polymorpha]|uniref:Protein JTB n=1 Tax=Dreissena polymorpha TaxID=45954 RepID=A0A9D4EM12_DREPO|nr:uncharacterized protein LOC127842646 [Dreissena polymorpha]XP_052228237.1 uncharacterized protein LOC127842646 [Dreissena polymorpha]XP_052228238.1 uncharacterized protein LOC127842646 [Dreissena polymorpha]KAH3781738.1 hypothetical protein DPMN_159642 [Dreissena polymorpha]
MIEFCTRKRMVLTILILLSLTVITLFVEGHWSASHKLADINSATEEPEGRCRSKELKIISECSPCKPLEMEQTFCIKTGYQEKVQCGNDKNSTFSRSCKLDPWIQEKRFWMLEIATCIVGLLSYSVVKYRQGILDQQLLEKVNRQIAA